MQYVYSIVSSFAWFPPDYAMRQKWLRLVKPILSGLQSEFCLVCLDDIVYSLMINLETIFSILKTTSLKCWMYAVFKIVLNTCTYEKRSCKWSKEDTRYKKMVRTLQCNSNVTLLWPMQLLKIYVKKAFTLLYWKNKDFMWRPLWSE